MNKEQLKEAVGELNLVDTVFEADGVSYIDTAVSVMQVYDLIEQLDKPEKVVVPKFVAEWYEKSKDELEFDIFNLVDTIGEEDYDELTEIEVWFSNSVNEPIETIMKMKLFGYEVEKEKLYVVEFNNDYLTNYLAYDMVYELFFISKTQEDILNKYKKKFTEKEIKDYDERYWAFAVEVAE